MNKIKYLLPIALIAIIISPMIVQADNFGVEIGDTFTFDCVAAEVSGSIGTNSATASGFTIDDHEIPVGTSVTVEVLDFETSLGNTTIYEVSSGSYAENGSSGNFEFQFGGLLMIFFPLLIVGSYINETDWNQTEAETPGELFMVPFVEPTADTWQVFKDLSTEIQTATSALFSDSDTNLTINADYTESAGEFLFESYIGGTVNTNFTDGSEILFVDYELEHHYQFAYDTINGVMKGMRQEGSIDGTSNSTDLSIAYNQHTELEGYNLPNYQFGGGFTLPFPAFGFYAALAAISSIFIIGVIIRRRKQ